MRLVIALTVLSCVAAGRSAAESISVSTTAEFRRAIDAAKRKGGTITLARGTYFLDEPIKLSAEHSNLTIQAADGAAVIVSGGRRLTGWRGAKLNGRDCWAADVPEIKAGKWFFRELWVDGKRAVRARQPNRGQYFHVKESPDAGDQWQVGQSRFRFEGVDIPAEPFAYGAEVIAMCRWIESRLPIKKVDADQHLVSLWRHSHFRLEPGDAYYVEGDGRWLDQPGEWFLDRDTGTVYYLPLPGQEMNKSEAIAPKLSTLLIAESSLKDKQFIENVTLRGITFSHSEWMLPEPDPASTKPADGGFDQAAIHVPAAAQFTGMRNSTLDRCTFEHLGTYALHLRRGCSHDVVTRCTFRDFGAGGIKIGEDTIEKEPNLCFANRITDCEIGDGGWVFPSGVGIWVGQSFDNVLSHNELHDLFYSGISSGWSWGYGDSLNRGNVIEHNRIHHIGKRTDGDGPILSDMGGVYLLGARQVSIVRNNVFHDIAGIKYGGWGIYLDEGSSDVTVENNLVYQTTDGGFHLHYGKDNIVRNNIFAFGRKWQIQHSKPESHNGFTLERNVIYWNDGPLFNAGATNHVATGNLYGPPSPAKTTAPTTRDANYKLLDPNFVDAAKGDFHIKDPANVKTIGFEPFDIDDVGPRTK